MRLGIAWLYASILLACGISALAVEKDFSSDINYPNIAKSKDPRLNTVPSIAETGYTDINAYLDNRNFSILSINLLAELPYQLEYFSRTDYMGSPGTERSFDFDQFRTEQNIFWTITEGLGLDLSFQWVIMSAKDNDIFRIGFRSRISSISVFERLFSRINLFYAVTLHLAQIDASPGWGWQVEHVYHVNVFPRIFKNSVYISGFIDHNVAPAGATFVHEHQLGVRLYGYLYGIVEWKHDGYQAKQPDGYAYGLEYLIHF